MEVRVLLEPATTESIRCRAVFRRTFDLALSFEWVFVIAPASSSPKCENLFREEARRRRGDTINIYQSVGENRGSGSSWKMSTVSFV